MLFILPGAHTLSIVGRINNMLNQLQQVVYPWRCRDTVHGLFGAKSHNTEVVVIHGYI